MSVFMEAKNQMSRDFFSKFDAGNDMITALTLNRQELKNSAEIQPRWQEYWELYNSIKSPEYCSLPQEEQFKLDNKLKETQQILNSKVFNLRNRNYEDLVIKKEGFFHKVNYKRKSWFEFKQTLRDIETKIYQVADNMIWILKLGTFNFIQKTAIITDYEEISSYYALSQNILYITLVGSISTLNHYVEMLQFHCETLPIIEQLNNQWKNHSLQNNQASFNSNLFEKMIKKKILSSGHDLKKCEIYLMAIEKMFSCIQIVLDCLKVAQAFDKEINSKIDRTFFTGKEDKKIILEYVQLIKSKNNKRKKFHQFLNRLCRKTDKTPGLRIRSMNRAIQHDQYIH